MQGATFFMGAGQKNPGLAAGGNDTLFNVSERLAAQWTLRDAVAVCRQPNLMLATTPAKSCSRPCRHRFEARCVET